MTETIMPLPPSVEFAYLIGVIAGDGCITRAGRGYKLEISCDAAYPELITIFQKLVSEVTGLQTSILKVKNKWLVLAYSFQCFESEHHDEFSAGSWNFRLFVQSDRSKSVSGKYRKVKQW